MKSSGLPGLFWEEAGEPWPKKIKIDRNNVNLEEEKQQQLLQRLHYATKKSSNEILGFSEVLCNAHKKSLELQNGNTINCKVSSRPYAHFKLDMNINLQSRLLRNIPFNENHSLENRDYSGIGTVYSELNEYLVTNPESWALYEQEREKSIETGCSWNELATISPVSNGIWTESLLARIKEFKTAPVFQSNENDADFHHDHDISRSRTLYQVLKPAAICDSSSVKILPFCLQARRMKGSESDLGSLFSKNKNEHKAGNISPFLKQTRCPENNNFKRNKEFQHLYKPYSRKHERVIKPKLVTCAPFELLLQDKRECNSSTANEKNDTSIFNPKTAFNIQLKEAWKENSSKECHVFSKATVESDNTFLIDDNEKEKKLRQQVLYDNHILQDNNIHSDTVWDTNLIFAKKEEDLTARSRHLPSVPNILKLSTKYSNLKMMVAIETCTQNKIIKALNGNSVFLRKGNNFNYGLRADQKHTAKRSRNSINVLKEIKNVPRYLGTYRKAVMGTRKYSNCKDAPKKYCSSVASGAHLSLFETYKKIPLCDDCEELHQISFISKAVFNYKNNEKCSKGYLAISSGITYNGHDALAYFLSKLFFSAIITKDNCSLVQENQNKNALYSNDISNSTTSISKQKSNSLLSPITGPNSRNILFLTSIIFHDLSIVQNTIASVKACLCKVALFGNRRKQNCCIFDKVIKDQPICRAQVWESLKHLKTVENTKVLLQKGIPLRYTYSPELVISVKQNVTEVENATIERTKTIKGNQQQNSILPCFKNESAKTTDSKDTLIEFSCVMKQEHFEDVTEKHLSSECKNKSEFKMKNQFDMVLKELKVFNDISKEDKNSFLCEQRNIIQEESLEFNCLDSILREHSKNIFENKEKVTFSTCTSLNYITVVNENTNGQIFFKDTGLKHYGEQEVPHGDCSSRIADEELFYPAHEEYFDFGCKQPLPWNPAFVFHTSMKEGSHSFQGERGNCFCDGVVRVQPLKTCHGPLRIGLSRKAKPKQLHPYLK